MAGKIKDVTGQRFGRLTAIERLEEKHHKHGYMWLCKCDCGGEATPYIGYLTSGHTTSCGCLRDEVNSTPKSYDDVIRRCMEKHDGKYSYPESNRKTYKNQKSRLEIICPIHGSFTRSVHNHLRGSYCSECYENIQVGQYSDKLFEENSELANESAYLYYLKIGSLYKIGITRVTIKKRIAKIKCESQKEVEILDYKKMTLAEAYRIEQEILEKYKDSRAYRNWSTELFYKDVLNGRLGN
jgi:hypothetical protein